MKKQIDKMCSYIYDFVNGGLKRIKFYNKFGSDIYIDYINEFLKKENPRKVLESIMVDVDIFITEYKKLSEEQLGKFYNLINKVVQKIEDIDIDIHYLNKLNRAQPL